MFLEEGETWTKSQIKERMGLLWETANSSVLLKPKVLKGSHQLKILYYVDLLEFVNLCSREQREESKTRRWLILLCRYLQDFSVYPPFCSSLAFLSSYLLGKLFWEKAGEETFPFGWNHYHLNLLSWRGVFWGRWECCWIAFLTLCFKEKDRIIFHLPQ